MELSERGLEFIKEREAFRAEAYQDEAGVWTIGYGDTLGVGPGDTITLEAAETRLRARVISYTNAVTRLVKVPLNQNQADSLISLAYNIGVGNFRKSSLLEYLNQGQYDQAATRFLVWCKVRDPKTGQLKFSAGLFARRKRERELFLKVIE